MSSPRQQQRPSDARRHRLKQSDSVLMSLSSNRISNMVPIERYYAMANKLLVQFHNSYSYSTQHNNHPHTHNLDKAYLYGYRFAFFSTQILTCHDYYNVNNKPHLLALRNQNILNTTNTIQLLEEITQRMDEEEEEEEGIEVEYNEWKQQQQQQRESKYNDEEEEEEDKYDLNDYEFHTCSTAAIANANRSSRKMDGSHINSPLVAILPPPLPPPSSSSSSLTTTIKTCMEHKIPIQTLIEMYTEDYKSFVEAQKIQYTYLPTYQGKKTLGGKDSTNGCTVISALIVAFHLACTNNWNYSTNTIDTMKNKKEEDDDNDGKDDNKDEQKENNKNENVGLSNIELQSIMDDIAPDLLLHIRSKLGLGNNALIIPSDVHDYLLEIQILQQEQFVSVIGGNILDPIHLHKVIQVLHYGKEEEQEDMDILERDYENNNRKKNSTTTWIQNTHNIPKEMDMKYTSSSSSSSSSYCSKMAMSFFFHEHVISILKVYDNQNTFIRYDWIDSMPHGRPDQYGDLAAVRIQVMDFNALEVLLRWYACDTFTEKDQLWINEQDWDESLCDTDPRVFQAYIWKQV